MGDQKTVAPSGGDAPAQWQEGLLVADRFRIVRFIGQGGMGKVYLAQDETLARPTALKRVPHEIIYDADARDDLRQEANRLLDLAHENIVRIHTFYEGPTWPFFAMEYLQGPTLKKLLRMRKQYGRTFTPREVLTIARQVAQGLSYAHAKGVIHRDMKPANLMLAAPPGDEITESDVVKITDFGVSRVIADSTMRHTGKRSGTLPYMSPEQFHGEPCTVQSDLYSLACTLYELLGGNPPFHSGDLGYQIVHLPPRPLEGVPKTMAAAILRGLSKDPRRRFRSVDEFLQALEGRAKAPRSGPLSRFRTVASALVCALLVSAIPWLVLSYVLPGGGDGPEAGPRQAPRDVATGAGATRDDGLEERNAFAARLRTELLRIPPVIGLKEPPASSSKETPFLVWETSPPPDPGTISLSFSLTEPNEPAHRALFQGLFFQVYRLEQNPKKENVRPSTAELRDRKKVFHLPSLQEGTYRLKAIVRDLSGGETDSILEDPPVQFTVDLTPPAFEVEFADPAALVSAEPPEFSTFHESVDLRLRPTGEPQDIAEAWSHLGTSFVKMPNPRSTTVALAPNAVTTCRFKAYDAAGNVSDAREIRIRRLRLEVLAFGLAGLDAVSGNLARVSCSLNVEGDQRPTLRYLVNGVETEPVEGDPEGVVPGDSPGGGVPFVATLRLPSANSNTLEVRYAWKEVVRPFSPPARINDVKVKVPKVTLVVDPPQRTRNREVRIEGLVEPMFDGLELYIDQSPLGYQPLALKIHSPVPPIASFSHELKLEPERRNEFRVICRYRGEQLESQALAFAVDCDTTPPRLGERVRFDPAGTRLDLSISPADLLRSLRVREIVGTQELEWRDAEWDVASWTYKYSTRLPDGPIRLQFELVDQAGNTALVEEVYTPAIAAAPGGRPPAPRAASVPGPEDPGPGSAAPAVLTQDGAGGSGTAAGVAPAAAGAPARSVSRTPGVKWLVSPFLEELGMDFVPFGHDRWEMSRIEVPERAWNEFLRAAKKRDVVGPGRPDHPMTLKDDSPDLVREFVKWFGERSGDDYVYEVPTAEQWIEAFTGQADPTRAAEMGRAWFRGEGPFAGAGFVSAPRTRYGYNTLLAIGSRPENRTPTGLLDMEANVQELVRVGDVTKVIGGKNRDASGLVLESRCLSPRPYDADTRSFEGSFTGLRLCRRPAGGADAGAR